MLWIFVFASFVPENRCPRFSTASTWKIYRFFASMPASAAPRSNQTLGAIRPKFDENGNRAVRFRNSRDYRRQWCACWTSGTSGCAQNLTNCRLVNCDDSLLEWAAGCGIVNAARQQRRGWPQWPYRARYPPAAVDIDHLVDFERHCDRRRDTRRCSNDR